MLEAARGKYRTEKLAKKLPVGHHRTTLSGHIFATIEKKGLSSNIFSRCLHNMVNIGLLPAEIGPVVWGTPANENGFRVLAASLLRGSQVVSVSQTLQR